MFKLSDKHIQKVIDLNFPTESDQAMIGKSIFSNKKLSTAISFYLCKDKEWLVATYPGYFVAKFKSFRKIKTYSKSDLKILNSKKEDIESEQEIIDTTMANKPLYERVPTMAKGDISPYDKDPKTIKDYLDGDQEAKDIVNGFHVDNAFIGKDLELTIYEPCQD